MDPVLPWLGNMVPLTQVSRGSQERKLRYILSDMCVMSVSSLSKGGVGYFLRPRAWNRYQVLRSQVHQPRYPHPKSYCCTPVQRGPWLWHSRLAGVENSSVTGALLPSYLSLASPGVRDEGLFMRCWEGSLICTFCLKLVINLSSINLSHSTRANHFHCLSNVHFLWTFNIWDIEPCTSPLHISRAI